MKHLYGETVTNYAQSNTCTFIQLQVLACFTALVNYYTTKIYQNFLHRKYAHN